MVKFWIGLGVGLTLLFLILERDIIWKQIKGWNEYQKIKEEFKPIDSRKSGKSSDSMKEIDAFYCDEKKMDEFLKDKNTLLLRKAHLLNNISEPGLFKEIKVIFFSTVFGIFLTKIFDTLMPTDDESQGILMGLYITLVVVSFVILFVDILSSFETKDQQIDRFEVSRIDKVLETDVSPFNDGKAWLIEYEDGRKSLVARK